MNYFKYNWYNSYVNTQTYNNSCRQITHWYWPGIEEAGPQDHDSFTGALFKLHLDGAEFAMDDADHALDLFGGDGPCARLLPQQIHDVGSELVTCLWSTQLLFWVTQSEDVGVKCIMQN